MRSKFAELFLFTSFVYSNSALIKCNTIYFSIDIKVSNFMISFFHSRDVKKTFRPSSSSSSSSTPSQRLLPCLRCRPSPQSLTLTPIRCRRRTLRPIICSSRLQCQFCRLPSRHFRQDITRSSAALIWHRFRTRART